MAGNTKNEFVVDASFFLAYLLPDEHINGVQKFFNEFKVEKLKLIASPLLPFEVFNGLQFAKSRKRVSLTIIKQLGEKFLQIPIVFEEIDYLKVLHLALKKRLTFYDASYLYLAQTKQVPLLTLDQHLRALVKK